MYQQREVLPSQDPRKFSKVKKSTLEPTQVAAAAVSGVKATESWNQKEKKSSSREGRKE